MIADVSGKGVPAALFMMRAKATLRGLLGARDAGTIIDGIVRDVDDFANGAEQADDITLLAFKLVSLVS